MNSYCTYCTNSQACMWVKELRQHLRWHTPSTVTSAKPKERPVLWLYSFYSLLESRHGVFQIFTCPWNRKNKNSDFFLSAWLWSHIWKSAFTPYVGKTSIFSGIFLIFCLWFMCRFFSFLSLTRFCNYCPVTNRWLQDQNHRREMWQSKPWITNLFLPMSK